MPQKGINVPLFMRVCIVGLLGESRIVQLFGTVCPLHMFIVEFTGLLSYRSMTFPVYTV